MTAGLRGIVSQLLAATLTTGMVMVPRPVQAAALQDTEIERLYIEGQERYSGGDFSGAADSWTRLLEKLPEAQANKATRENVLLNITQAYLDAYNRSRRDDGSKDIENLRNGKGVLDKYYADYNRAYGDRAGVSQAVQEKSDELEQELRKAEEDAKAREAKAAGGDPTAPDPNATTPDPNATQQPTEKVIVLKPQNAGNGLIVGGAVVGVLGIGALAMGAVGAVRAPKAEEDFMNATTELEREEADFRGKQANQLTIAGFVLAPLLLGGAAAMLVIGIKQKQKANRELESGVTALAPAVGPNQAGFVLRGRF